MLTLLALGACAAGRQATTTREVVLEPPAPPTQIAVTFPRPLDLTDVVLHAEAQDLADLVKQGLKAGQAKPGEGHRYFLRVAERAPGTELALFALAAAAMDHLAAGGREAFLDLHPRLEEALARRGRPGLPPEIADLVALGRYMKERRVPTTASAGLRELLGDLERTR
jgi:hypothetical protein